MCTPMLYKKKKVIFHIQQRKKQLNKKIDVFSTLDFALSSMKDWFLLPSLRETFGCPFPQFKEY